MNSHLNASGNETTVLKKLAEKIDASTPDTALSPEQLKLKQIAVESLVAARDAVGKLRVVAQFIREHHIALGQTQNQILIAAGFNKSRSSEICKIALDTDKTTFDRYFEGAINFRMALADARATSAAEVEAAEEPGADGSELEADEATNEAIKTGDPQAVLDFEIAKATVALDKAIEVAVRKLEILNQLDHSRVKDGRLGGIYSKPKETRSATEKATNDYRLSYNRFTVTFEAFSSEANRENLQKIGA